MPNFSSEKKCIVLERLYEISNRHILDNKDHEFILKNLLMHYV